MIILAAVQGYWRLGNFRTGPENRLNFATEALIVVVAILNLKVRAFKSLLSRHRTVYAIV